MAQIDLGKIKFNWKGAYADSTAYAVDDVVYAEGTAYVCTAALTSSNTTNPKANSSFAVFTHGLNNTGAYSSSTTYYFNDIVTYQNASYVRKNITASANVVPTTTSTWLPLVGAPPGSVMTTSGDIEVKNNEATTIRLPIGSKHQVLTATEDILESFANSTDNYSLGVDYIVNSGKANLELVGTSTNIGSGDASTNATITLTRGKKYKFVFPANSKTYSIKDTTVSGYETGTTGRLSVAQGVNVLYVTNGGTIEFTPNLNTTTLAATTVAIRDESSSATTDFVNITLVSPALTPQWKDSVTNYGGWSCTNNTWNTQTDVLDPLPQHLKRFGRGGSVAGNYRACGFTQGGYLSVNGHAITWGGHYHDGSVYSGYGSWGVGTQDGNSGKIGYEGNALQTQFRLPNHWFKALAGDSTYAKFLNDPDGNSIGYGITGYPRITQALTSSTQCLWLMENGMVFFSGYATHGGRGSGVTTPHAYSAVCVPFHDTAGNLLTGANIPQIKLISGAIGGDKYGAGGWYIALDTDGYLYTWGDGASGKLGHDATTDLHEATRIDPASFAVSGTNKKIIWAGTQGFTASGITHAIDEDGNYWAWGDNLNGGLGDNTETDKHVPTNISAVSSSPLNNKVVTHVAGCCGDVSNQNKTYILTSEGKVYFTGFNESYGKYTGHYTTNSADVLLPVEIYNSSNTINSVVNGTAQKAIAIWPSGGCHGSVYIQTDGGGTPSEPKVYSAGTNNIGQLGNGSSTTHGASASAVGNWTLKEIEFDDAGSYHIMTASGTATDKVTGTQWSTAIKNAMKPGKIVTIIGGCHSTDTEYSVMALDENGIIYWAGDVDTQSLISYYEYDNQQDADGTSAEAMRFTRVWSQPEPMVDITFSNTSSGTETGWVCVGESGVVYTGGSTHSWHQNSTYTHNHALKPVAQSMLTTGSTR
jgi:hypothetical protein